MEVLLLFWLLLLCAVGIVASLVGVAFVRGYRKRSALAALVFFVGGLAVSAGIPRIVDPLGQRTAALDAASPPADLAEEPESPPAERAADVSEPEMPADDVAVEEAAIEEAAIEDVVVEDAAIEEAAVDEVVVEEKRSSKQPISRQAARRRRRRRRRPWRLQRNNAADWRQIAARPPLCAAPIRRARGRLKI